MPRPKEGKSRDGAPMHYSVGALIEMGGRYLLIDRANFPFGFAGVAGHIDEGENEIQALKREVEEESGLKVERFRLIFEEPIFHDRCSRGITGHYWYLFECSVSGELKQDESEAKSIGWYSKEKIQNLKLEPAWEHWFKKLNIIE
ncbi:NUDIX hydrolase [Candidatus Azambacteria bacterium]|nr:NUDIX hydrolase [Candidatus Azambacteria bacterium]